MTGVEMAAQSWAVLSRLGPVCMPSRVMSVNTMAATSGLSNLRAASKKCSPQSSVQPCTATMPSRASMPMTTRPGKSSAASWAVQGSRAARVPRITRSTPSSRACLRPSRSRTPPPSCTGMLRPAQMRSITAALAGRPSTAPSRSTTCRRTAPWSCQWRAMATGSWLNTVSRSMRPCCKRTQRPPLRSTAGMASKALLRLLFGRGLAPGEAFHDLGHADAAPLLHGVPAQAVLHVLAQVQQVRGERLLGLVKGVLPDHLAVAHPHHRQVKGRRGRLLHAVSIALPLAEAVDKAHQHGIGAQLLAGGHDFLANGVGQAAPGHVAEHQTGLGIGHERHLADLAQLLVERFVERVLRRGHDLAAGVGRTGDGAGDGGAGLFVGQHLLVGQHRQLFGHPQGVPVHGLVRRGRAAQPQSQGGQQDGGSRAPNYTPAFHNTPLVEETPRWRSCRAVAWSRARPRALKAASSKWWSLSPQIRRTCRVRPAFSARARQNSSASWPSKPPTVPGRR
eukprot:TRINITY_DN2582_c0_g2_i1.p1 TRINITY_DN2582_c0_g2~~TRINITY_DN2582_c0_g2_i1.p1  ORF type:complete len:507 (-),score=145.21 TRINITY_DN2582_c0_g2_i1:939-2459(-)